MSELMVAFGLLVFLIKTNIKTKVNNIMTVGAGALSIQKLR